MTMAKVELLEKLRKLRISEKDANALIAEVYKPPQGKVYPIGSKRYAVHIWADDMTDHGWESVKVIAVDNTENLADIKRLFPDIEQRIKQAQVEKTARAQARVQARAQKEAQSK